MSAHDLMYPFVERGQIPCGLCYAAHIRAQGSEKVPIRDDAAQFLVLVHHEQMVKIHGVKDLFDHLQPIVNFDGDDRCRHDVPHNHRYGLVHWGASSSSSNPILYYVSSSLSTRKWVSGLRVFSCSVWSIARFTVGINRQIAAAHRCILRNE